jgi:Ser/Thr protein kinase RdoA (MazF antagonist)
MFDEPQLKSIVQEQYALEAREVTALDVHVFDWRAIVRLGDSQGHRWLLRLLRLPEAYAAHSAIGLLLEWLARHGAQAPRVRRTTTSQVAGRSGDWSMLLLTYVEGQLIARTPDELGMLGHALGRLHALPLGDASGLPPGRCHPAQLATIRSALLARAGDLPEALQPIVDTLIASVDALAAQARATSITHGDCWYANAVRSGDAATLIDWDRAGTGAPVLDLGYLLLSAHFDLARPFEVVADPLLIAAILDGYQRARALTPSDMALLAHAVRFPSALQLAGYLDGNETPDRDDPALHKQIARYAATAPIAALACAHLAVR